MSKPSKARKVARTVLIVGEGDAEVCFLQHLKSLYVQRGSGVVVTIKNARGKGALHVVDFAIRQSRNAEYDVKVALLDADTDWNDKTRKWAKSGKVQVLPCVPCLEADLLRCHDVAVYGLTSAQLKAQFLKTFNQPASVADVYKKQFSAEVLADAQAGVEILAALLALLSKGVSA